MDLEVYKEEEYEDEDAISGDEEGLAIQQEQLKQ